MRYAMLDALTQLPAQKFVQRSLPGRLVMGPGAMESLAAELAELGITKPLVLVGRRTRESALFTRVIQALEGMHWVDGADVPQHSSVALVEKLWAQARDQRVDGFITVGGGSAVDTAKAVAILLAEGGKLADHALRFTPPDVLHIPQLKARKLPIVAVPVTASGAEVTPSVGIRTPDGAKLLMHDPQVPAKLVILDQDATREVPAAILCSTAMNALAHCIEGLYSRERTPMAQTLALEAIARLHVAIPAVSRDPTDIPARAQLMYGAHLAGQVLIHARSCLHHALCHVIGSVTGVAHGDANSVMLPHCVEFNSASAGQALQLAAAAAEIDGSAPELASYLRQLQQTAKVPQRLRELGIDRALLATIAHQAMHERGLYFNPRPITSEQEVLALLEAAY